MCIQGIMLHMVRTPNGIGERFAQVNGTTAENHIACQKCDENQHKVQRLKAWDGLALTFCFKKDIKKIQ